MDEVLAEVIKKKEDAQASDLAHFLEDKWMKIFSTNYKIFS